MKCLRCGANATQYGPSDPHRVTGDTLIKYRCPSCGWRTYVSAPRGAEECRNAKPLCHDCTRFDDYCCEQCHDNPSNETEVYTYDRLELSVDGKKLVEFTDWRTKPGSDFRFEKLTCDTCSGRVGFVCKRPNGRYEEWVEGMQACAKWQDESDAPTYSAAGFDQAAPKEGELRYFAEDGMVKYFCNGEWLPLAVREGDETQRILIKDSDAARVNGVYKCVGTVKAGQLVVQRDDGTVGPAEAESERCCGTCKHGANCSASSGVCVGWIAKQPTLPVGAITEVKHGLSCTCPDKEPCPIHGTPYLYGGAKEPELKYVCRDCESWGPADEDQMGACGNKSAWEHFECNNMRCNATSAGCPMFAPSFPRQVEATMGKLVMGSRGAKVKEHRCQNCIHYHGGEQKCLRDDVPVSDCVYQGCENWE